MISYSEFSDPRDTRLAVEHEKLDELCNASNVISYSILKQPNKRKPPEAYTVSYSIRTIIGINSDQSPIYNQPEKGDIVKVNIEFPAEYPDLSKGQVLCTVVGVIFHPNINSYKEPKGRICINQPALGSWMTIDDLAIHIGEILQWKNYLADLNKSPYPMDSKVAKWVSEYAEPKGIVKPNGEKPIDNQSLKTRTETGKRTSPTESDDWEGDFKPKGNSEPDEGLDWGNFKLKGNSEPDEGDLDWGNFKLKGNSEPDEENLDWEDFKLK